MKYKIIKNRKLVQDEKFAGYNKENRAEKLEFEIPDTLKDYAVTINFQTDDNNFYDVLDDNIYVLKNNLTKYNQVNFYLEFKKQLSENEYEIVKTEISRLEFNDSFDVDKEISEEEITVLDKVIVKANNAINRANAIAEDLENKVATDYYRGATGEKGEDGVDGQDGRDGQDGYTPQKGIDYFTEQDIEEIEGDILNEVYTKSEADTLLDEKADIEDIPDVSNFITKDVNNLTNYTLKTNTGSLIDLEINDTTYVVTLKLKNLDGTIISADTIDLPLESVVVSGRYDNTTKKVILTLENGNEVDFSVADLVAGLQTEITSSNKLASDLVDDTNSGNKFVTTSEKQTWNNKLDQSDLTDYATKTYVNNLFNSIVDGDEVSY